MNEEKKDIHTKNNKQNSSNRQSNNNLWQDWLLSQSIATSLVTKKWKFLLGWKFLRKRASYSIPTLCSGSITVEATIALPIFLFFLMNLTSVFLIFHVHSQIDSYLYKIVKQLSIMGYPLENGLEPSSGMSFVGEILTIQGLQVKLNQELKSFGVLGSPISLAHSELFENDYISIIATYQVVPLVKMIPFTSFEVVNQCHMRCFTGYKFEDHGTSSNGEEYVYITEHGTVYHLSTSCTYLNMTITSVGEGAVADSRNQSGAKYYPCENCNDRSSNIYYITQYGTRYHTTSECTSIDRAIITVPLSEVSGRSVCSKCVG
ncbi:MAG: TadE family protein [Eubacteriales bacterium]